MGTVKGVVRVSRVMFPKGVSKTNGGFTIASFEAVKTEEGKFEANPIYNTFSIKGIMPSIEVGGEYYVIAEEGERHPQYGLSYDAVFMRTNIELDVEDEDSVKSFLEVILTKRQVNSLFEAIGNPINALETKDVKSLTKAKGIGSKTAERIIEHYESQKDYSYAYIELGKFDIPPKTIRKVTDWLGSPELAVQKIKENPYELMSIDGYAFKKCDEIFLKLGGKPNDDLRIKSFLIYCLQEQANSGHTWSTPMSIIDSAVEFIPDANMANIGRILNDNPDVFYITEDKKRVSLLLYHRLEAMVSNELSRIISAKSEFKYDGWKDDVAKIEEEQGWSFTEQQIEAMEMMLTNNVSILQGYGGTGKAMPKWLEIPTPNGSMKLGDIKVGDYVLDRLGKPTKVLGVYPQGMLDTYEVTLADGRKTWCNDEHLWSYYTSKGNLKTSTLREIMDKGLFHNGTRNARFKIPVAKAVEYDEKEFDIDPYVLGAFLGDGSLTCRQLTLSSDDEFVVKEVADIIGAKGYKKNSDKNYSWSFLLEEEEHKSGAPVKTRFHTRDIFGNHPELMCLAESKRIPKEYFYGSIEQRLSLVQGLMDTDGSINKGSRANIRFSTSSKGLAEDFQFILRSLGYHSTIREDNRSGRNTCYEMMINIDNSEKHKLFRLPRRKDVAMSVIDQRKHRDYSKVGIVDIKKMDRKDDMVCIYVENDEHLFLANDFIVTHNTTVLKAVVGILEKNGYVYAQTALSGKASANLTLVTGKEGKTIHRLLGFNPMEGGGFEYNAKNQLPYDIIIIDEVSMVDAKLFGFLLKAVRSGSKIIMLGDSEQLESIGIPIMKPMIDSGMISTMTLTKIHRQAQMSAVVTDSIMIRKGVQVLGQETGRVVHGELQDLEYDLVPADDDIFVNVLKEFHKHVIVNKEDVMDVQVLTQQREKGKASCLAINRACQKIYNPEHDLREEVMIGSPDKPNSYILREGDKVINVKNNYGAEDESGNRLPVFNGNIGIIEKFDIDVNGDKFMLVDFEGIGKVVIYEEDYRTIELAYCITVHKSQGSSNKIIIIALPFHYMLNTRQLLYTAITRTRKHCVVVATKKTIVSAINKDEVSKKRTYLSEYLNSRLTYQIPDVIIV